MYTIDWFEHNTTHKQQPLNNKQQNMFNTNATYHIEVTIASFLNKFLLFSYALRPNTHQYQSIIIILLLYVYQIH